ncbi:ABC transporter ATP-binding protein [bacterium]|nr:MAG: ABC transporter ATP-binding protein [bacterium]
MANKPAHAQALLELKNVRVHYGGVKALDGVDISLFDGEVVALMGPNGAGKSTVLKAIAGIAPVDNGTIAYCNKPITPVVHLMAHKGIVLVPQGRRVFTRLTVEENLELGGFIIKNKNELKERIEDILKLFPALKKKRTERAGTLSGGQQQMVALARGLIVNPKALLLDEPSLGLAPKLVKEVFAKIREINQIKNTAILVVEHNVRTLLETVNRAYVLDKGKVAAEGTAEKILKSDILEKVFLGKLNG